MLEDLLAEKIGMCCSCGGYFNKSETVIMGDMEYCHDCLDEADEDTEKFLQSTNGMTDDEFEDAVLKDWLDTK